jgi:hypothetical protein
MILSRYALPNIKFNFRFRKVLFVIAAKGRRFWLMGLSIDELVRGTLHPTRVS